jgi:hypothetical protein
MWYYGGGGGEMHSSQKREYKKRGSLLAGDFLSVVIAIATTLLLLTPLFILASGMKMNLESAKHMLAINFRWFGAPFLILPFLNLFSPETENFYASIGIYYGGALLSKIIGVPWGFLIAIFIAYKFIRYLENSRPT